MSKGHIPNSNTLETGGQQDEASPSPHYYSGSVATNPLVTSYDLCHLLAKAESVRCGPNTAKLRWYWRDLLTSDARWS